MNSKFKRLKMNISKVDYISNLPTDALTHILSYLEGHELCLAERVSTTWNAVIRCENQYLWKSLCQSMQLSNPDETKFTYKEVAMPVRGLITVVESNIYINFLFKQPSENGGLRWGTDQGEACVRVMVYSKDSQQECANEHQNKCTYNQAIRGTWHEKFKRIPGGGDFPKHLPLKLFYDNQGLLKKEGDKIHLLYEGRFIILTCAPQGPDCLLSPMSFTEQLENSIQNSTTASYITQKNIQFSIQSAKEANGWISSD